MLVICPFRCFVGKLNFDRFPTKKYKSPPWWVHTSTGNIIRWRVLATVTMFSYGELYHDNQLSDGKTTGNSIESLPKSMIVKGKLKRFDIY
jgi:hypothetical protein